MPVGRVENYSFYDNIYYPKFELRSIASSTAPNVAKMYNIASNINFILNYQKSNKRFSHYG